MECKAEVVLLGLEKHFTARDVISLNPLPVSFCVGQLYLLRLCQNYNLGSLLIVERENTDILLE